jgi:lysophospholipase L1-like esterase
MQILVFGDSIVYGSGDKQGGWVQRLRAFLERKYSEEPFVYNLGIPGATTKEILKGFEFEFRQRWYKTGNTLIFEIGSNDSAFLKSNKGKEWISPMQFERNIKEIIKRAKKTTKKIFFIGLTPVDESKTKPIPWDKNVNYENKNIEEYNKIINAICKKEKVPFIEILGKFKKHDYKKLLSDGVHPNEKGHELIFQEIKKSI